MHSRCRTNCVSSAVVVGLIAWAGSTQFVMAEGATRDLSGYLRPGVTFTVSIALDPPRS